MRVLVTGGTGYLGRIAVLRLMSDGHDVVVLQRRESRRPMVDARVTVAIGDLLSPDSLRAAMSDCEAVVHLVGIIRESPRRGITMQRLHVEATRTVLAAAQHAGLRRVVHMSALGSRANAVSKYHRTKWEAETLVRTSGLVYTILRPSVIFGKGGPGPHFVAQLADLVRMAPVVPVIGHGQFQLQPVSIHTVAQAISSSLVSPSAENKDYELCGPDVLTYVQILQRIATVVGKPLRTVRVPLRVMSAAVPLLERLPQFPITQDQLTMLIEGNTCKDCDSVYRDLSLSPMPFDIELSDLKASSL